MENNAIKLTLVIPVYNEEKRLPTTLSRLSEWSKCKSERREVIFSDDGSTDKSAELIERATLENPKLRLIRGERNMGKGAAVKRGMLEAEGEYVIFTDCDLAYGLEAVDRLALRLKESSCDIIVGSRVLHPNGYGEYSRFRRLTSRLYMDVLKLATGLSQTDSQCGIKGFRTPAAKAVFSECTTNGFAFDLEVLTVAKNQGLKIGELAVNVIDHDQSISKVDLIKDSIKMLRDVRTIKKTHKQSKNT